MPIDDIAARLAPAGKSSGVRFRVAFNAYFGTDFQNGPPEAVLGAMAEFLERKLREGGASWTSPNQARNVGGA